MKSSGSGCKDLACRRTSALGPEARFEATADRPRVTAGRAFEYRTGCRPAKNRQVRIVRDLSIFSRRVRRVRVASVASPSAFRTQPLALAREEVTLLRG